MNKTLAERIAIRIVDLERTAACDPLYGPAAARDAALLRECREALSAAEERGRSADHYARQIRDTAHLIRGHLLDLERLLDSRYAGIDKHPFPMLERLLTDIRDSADAIERAAPAEAPMPAPVEPSDPVPASCSECDPPEDCCPEWCPNLTDAEVPTAGLGCKCEGCGHEAVTRDTQGTPLCGECYDALDEVPTEKEG